ncbi:MAG TPA: hypothetical protein PK264_24190, partial [Hyphomicrobiaceae bacterium]|nr:hypothetical protein [Hyphomicrobiaceae bacterium]
ARRGVPQSRQIHILLAAGHRDLERIVPGFDAALEGAGAPEFDAIGHWHAHSQFGWFPVRPSEIKTRLATRGLVEHVVRQSVLAHANVTLLERTRIAAIPFADGAAQGFMVRSADTDRGEERLLPADLVVDASGRQSRLPQALEASGCGATAETVIDARIGYACRWYNPPPGRTFPWRFLLIRNPRLMQRVCGIALMENGQWLVNLAGYGGDYPPNDVAGFEAFLASIGCDEVARALKDAEPVSDIAGYRDTVNRWRHFERLAAWPDRLLAVGDAVCAFNPVYGQGMSAAAREAQMLASTLGQGTDLRMAGACRRLQKDLARFLAGPWTLATGEDYRFATTLGPPRPRLMRLAHWFTDRVMQAATTDSYVQDRFMRVMHMVDAPLALANPLVVARALLSPRAAPSIDGGGRVVDGPPAYQHGRSMAAPP